jgi:hypothetical protein
MLVPLALMEKAVVDPAQTEVLEGFEVIEGAEFTVRVAVFEVAGGEQVPLTTQRYW